MGDFNADIKSSSIFLSELIEFCNMNDLCFIDKSMLLSDTFTYVSQSHNTTSWLDHCITTGAGKSIVTKMDIVDNIVSGFLIRRSSAIRRFIAGFLTCDNRTI